MALWDKIQNGTPNNSSATKTPYQQIFSKPVEQEWKVGDQPTNYGQALATINAMYKVNPTGAQEKLSLLNQYRTQPGNMWYDPFSAATNSAVSELQSYGINPADLTPDWFKANTSWQGYLSYNGTTTTPSKPGKKASGQEKAAYALYQYQKSMDVTNAAKNEWTAAQGEINYWANRKDLNLSDDDIISKVFGSGKYSTLKKMDDSRSTGSPLELNEAIDYNQDSVRGAIWAARNGGGTGNIRQDIANYYLKSGNSWKDDPNISAKLNIDNLDTFSRYELGMAGDGMDKAGVYFGAPSFSKADVEALRNNVDWEDETSVKMYQTVLAAEETTEKAEAELANLTKAFQRRLNRGFKDQNEANKWIDSQLESSDYSTLAKMDASLKSGKIMDMTRAVPYRKQMLQQMAVDSIANPKKTGNEILSSYGMPVSDADDSVIKVENERVGSAIDALGSFLSQGEKDYFDAVPGVDYAKVTAGFGGIAEGMKSGMINITNNATKYASDANGKYNKTWLGSLASRNQYERYQATAERLAAEVGAFEQQNGTQILASENIESEPVFSLDDGTQVQLIYDDETGEYEIGNVWNDMWRFNQPSTELLTAAEARAEEIRIEQNSRANNIRTAQSEAGEMNADTVKGIEEYNKKKEQLAVLNDYLEANKAGYEQSIRDAETAKANRDALGEIAAKAMGIEYDPSTADSIMQFAGGWYDYESPPADGFTIIEESSGKSGDDIKAEIDANNANVQDLQFVLSMLGDNAPEDLKQKINQAISDAERQNRVYGDYMITKNPRFDYLARKGQESLHFTEMDEPVEGMNKNWFFMMSDEEKKIYYALVNTDGIEAADRFYVDIRDMMTYDLAGGWMSYTAHHSALYTNEAYNHQTQYDAQFSADLCIKYFEQNYGSRIDMSQVLIGVAPYTHGWGSVKNDGRDPENPGLFATASPNSVQDAYGFYQIPQLMQQYGVQEYFDNKAKAAYYYSPTQGVFFTIDNAKSAAAKGNYVREKSLGGLIAWMASLDRENVVTKGMFDGLYDSGYSFPAEEFKYSVMNFAAQVTATQTGYEITIKNNENAVETNIALRDAELFQKTISFMKFYIKTKSGAEFSAGEMSGTVTNENGIGIVDPSENYDAKHVKPGSSYTFSVKVTGTPNVSDIVSIIMSQRATPNVSEFKEQSVYTS